MSLPAAIVFAIGGALACFAGYRLFRFVLGLYGFYLGAMIATTSLGESGTWALVIAVLVGGIVGAVLMYAAYFLGVGLIGAGLAALALNAGWRAAAGADPPTLVLVIVCVVGALAALAVVRGVIIFGTAIAGAWTLLIAALAIAGMRAVSTADFAKDIWIVYPLNPLPDAWWVTVVWIALSLAGIVVQMATSPKATRAAPRRFR